MAVQDVINSEPTQSPGSMYLAKCILKSSVVLHAVYGHIRSPATDDVVLGKETALELLVLVEDGSVQSVCEQLVFGTIKDLKVLPWNEQNQLFQPQAHGKDLLVLLSDSGKLSFLTFDTGLHRFLAVKHIHLSAPGNSLHELGWSLAIESRGHAIAVAAFQDRVAIFPTTSISESKMDDKGILYPEEHPKSITAGKDEIGWGTLWSMTFVSTFFASKSSIDVVTDLVLAVLLYRKGSIGNEVQILVCNSRERKIEVKACYNPSGIPSSSPMAFHILEIPAVPGFILLFRPGDIVLIDVSIPSTPQTCAVIPLLSYIEDEGAHYSLEEEGTHLGDEEKSFSVAASALLELYTRAREGTEHVSNINEGRAEVGLANIEAPASSICTTVPHVYSWSWEPESLDHPPRLVIGLNTGEICFAIFSPGGSDKVKINISECLYKCSPCNSLLWTRGGFIAAMVEMGDGQILKLVDGRLVQQSLIQKLAPIIDFSLGDYYGEKQDQMFAACGVGEEGSIRVVRNGVSVEKLLSTPPLYPGVTGTWTMRICHTDQYHAFLVISFVEETRVLSVGLNFVDITEAVGFHPSSNTLACGLLEDGWVTQVCCTEVHVCAPTKAAHPAGMECIVPLCSSWKPQDHCISLGAVASQKVILSMSRPGLIILLSTSMTSAGVLELVEIQRCLLEAEVSCISIPQEDELVPVPVPPTIIGLLGGSKVSTFPDGVEVGKVCVVGTHKPSVELLSIVPGEMFSSVAVGVVSLVSSVGTAMSGCVPQDVRLVLFDRLYILTGLRNGMLLRYEWPDNCTTSVVSVDVPLKMDVENLSRVSDKHGDWGIGLVERSAQLHLIAVRRIGVSPVSLIPLQASLRADIIALSDRPWLLQTARHSQRIAYTSISFQPSTHVTPVSSLESPKGILFVAECSLHLVEMEHSKRLNVQKLPVKSTPRRVLYHSETKTLLVMHTETSQEGYNPISNITCVDPLSGTTHSCYKFENGEVAKSMQLWNTGNDQVLLVGTALISGRILMPSGEAESAKGRVIVFHLQPKRTDGDNRTFASYISCSAGSSSSYGSSSHCSDQTMSDIQDEDSKHGHKFAEGESWDLIFKSSVALPGVVLAVTPYMAQYILASASNSLFCLGFLSDAPKRLRKLSTIKTRFLITSIASHLTRIAVGDCRDGVLIYTYREDLRKLEQLYCDPMQRLVADCVLVDFDTPIATDRHGNFCALSCPSFSEEGNSPERNLKICCWYHIGEISMSIRKGSFAYKVPVEESMKICSGTSNILSDTADYSVVASTVLGSVFVFIRLTGEEYELLEAVQTRLAESPLAAPLLGNNHARFRGQGCPVGVKKALDGDMLGQFLELTSAQQEAVLNEQSEDVSDALSPVQPGLTPPLLCGRFPMERVLRLLERLHNSLT
ncbi:hypothetical protein O6H91_02G071600 [Diphasiastrum complanatum]|uniref:Uncharacterized protein n=2 Tax=Diphasiastrum complanatum TaxID=34168 RepID=A0ACC2EGT1_DIPCM|nr:hypothetical protein O6H91_02G071600 [Diphasiastrum complanatum]KAJ7565695.1 hypothetical protein O6H91_02G071600 [Diphasiastrum complanatum]